MRGGEQVWRNAVQSQSGKLVASGMQASLVVPLPSGRALNTREVISISLGPTPRAKPPLSGGGFLLPLAKYEDFYRIVPLCLKQPQKRSQQRSQRRNL